MVLTVLSYGEMEDIQNTRVWQSKKVQHCTETRSNWKASGNNNMVHLRWIHGFIGDTSNNRQKGVSKLSHFFMLDDNTFFILPLKVPISRASRRLFSFLL